MRGGFEEFAVIQCFQCRKISEIAYLGEERMGKNGVSGD